MNIKQLMKQAQQMQDQMQRQMASIRVEGSAGGGMVKAEMSGEKIIIETRVAAAEATPARRSEDKPAPLRDDPVLSAFRKHLGGELVKEKR